MSRPNLSGTRVGRPSKYRDQFTPQQLITAFCARNGICTGCRIRWALKPSSTCQHCKDRAKVIRDQRRAKKREAVLPANEASFTASSPS